MAWLTGWSNRKKITVPSASVSATQTNFPLRVQVLDDADVLAAMKAGGDTSTSPHVRNLRGRTFGPRA